MTQYPSLVFLSLGSNLGERRGNLLTAVELLAGFCEVTRVSPLYETEPVEHVQQPWFLNCAVAAETGLQPEELLLKILGVEMQMGRRRDCPKGPRTIDLDILLFGERILNRPGLTIPHPAMHLRRFVLAPLADIAPQALHPVLRLRVDELLRGLRDSSTVRKLAASQKLRK